MTTYYISPTGNDSTGDGSYGNPWLTTQKAITGSTVGDTITLKNGTYTWSNCVYMNASRTFQAETSGQAIIDGGSGLVGPISFGLDATTANLTGIIFQNAKRTASIYGNPAVISLLSSSSSTTFYNITNCVFKNIAFASYDFYSGGLIGGGNAGTWVGTLKIQNCLVNDCYIDYSLTGNNSGSIIMGRGSAGTNIILYNNAFYFKTGGVNQVDSLIGHGYFDVDPSCSLLMKNNIVDNATGNVIKFQEYTGNVPYTTTSTNNCYFNLTGNPSGTGDITGDPQFVDPTNGNFELQLTSPCIDTGILI